MSVRFGGFVGDLVTLRSYINDLISFRDTMYEQVNNVMKIYANTSGWQDQAYQQLGIKQNEVKGKINYLIKTVDDTIVYLKELYAKIEYYLSIG